MDPLLCIALAAIAGSLATVFGIMAWTFLECTEGPLGAVLGGLAMVVFFALTAAVIAFSAAAGVGLAQLPV